MAGKTAKRTAPRTPRAEVEVPEDQFTLVPGEGIEWRIAGDDYRLRKVRVGEWRDLHEQRLSNQRKVLQANVAALALPTETPGEQEARYTALQAARDLAYDLAMEWWQTMFAMVCVTAALPDTNKLPGWATDPAAQERALAHLVGPFDSGPSPDPET